jgi:hypothetical protein
MLCAPLPLGSTLVTFIKAVSDAWVVDVNIEHGDGTITGVTFSIEADGALSARIAHFTTVSRPCR